MCSKKTRVEHPQNKRKVSNLNFQKLAILLAAMLAACHFFEKNTLFRLLSPKKTGVLFENRVAENEKTNVLEYMNIYTGVGVAAGDVNNDGLVDLFFAGNQVTCRLFLNKGNLTFDDATDRAGIRTDRWCTGVTMADVNADGWLDIYVCVSGNSAWASTANLLFINKKDGTFEEKAADFGIADARLCMHSTFFDYDLDGDLDLFLITNPADQMVTGVNNVTAAPPIGEQKGADILYKNDGNGHFSDVSAAAGITGDGYSLGAAVSDFNADGWPDIYVSNDFLSSDLFYINQRDGTFKNQLAESFKHTSFASMGNDAADANNDGLPDLFVLDMLPEDNFRRKMLIPATNIDKFNLATERGFARQYTRNTLQMNCGMWNTDYGLERGNPNSAIRNPQFKDVSLLAGVAATDWSWSPLFADFDLDGDKDLLVTNGFYRDLGDLDYINYQFSQRSPMGNEASKRAKKLADIHGLPTVPLQNYLFENLGTRPVPTFKNCATDWGLTEKTFTNGACFADLDNDGDLEIVMNEFNGAAKIYENRARQAEAEAHFLTIKLAGNSQNPMAFGAKITVFTPDCAAQFLENQPARGYESSMDPRLFFGLGKNEKADSLVVEWGGGGRQVLKNVAADQFLEVRLNGDSFDFLDGHDVKSWQSHESKESPFRQITASDFQHVENNFIDFKNQILLPHGHSKQSPALAVGDADGDGLADFFVSGALGGESVLFFQKKDGSGFSKKTLETACPADETAAHFFDKDGDGDLDLYVVRGGSEFREGAAELQDALFENDGSGSFSQKKDALPDTKSAGGCVAAGDFDRDGDVDLFVGGQVAGDEWPRAPRSFLLKNDGKGRFSDETPAFLKNIGMVTDALFADFDGDSWPDLALAGEFMPVQIFKNASGKIHHSSFIVHHSNGWWNCLDAADFDGDGDLDLLGGNLGLNSRYHASEAEPLTVFSKDFDGNGITEPIICHFDGGERQIFHTRDELAAQVPAMKKRFTSYHVFAENGFEKSFRKEELAGAVELRAECFESSFFENLGGGKFAQRPLPLPAQVAPLQDFLVDDFNGDGKLDFLAVGNSSETEYTTGRYDAGAGCLFLGDGRGGFSFVENKKSGFWADGDARSVIQILMKNGQKRVVVGNNGAGLMEFLRKNGTVLMATQ